MNSFVITGVITVYGRKFEASVFASNYKAYSEKFSLRNVLTKIVRYVNANGEQIITLITTDGAFEAPGGLKSFDPKCDSAIPMPASIPPESIITVIYKL